MSELPEDVKALLRRGDPANEVSPQLVARVAVRLEPRAIARTRWQRALLVGAMLGGVAMGAVGTVALSRAVPGLVSPATRPALPSPPPSRGDDPVTREAALVQAALDALARGAHDEALSRLDQRDRDFPRGALGAESRVGRVRVLLAKGDDAAALEHLSALPPADVTPALRTSWVQLLVRRQACEAARQVAAPLDAATRQGVLGACAVQGAP